MKESKQVLVKRKGQWILVAREVLEYNRLKARERRDAKRIQVK